MYISVIVQDEGENGQFEDFTLETSGSSLRELLANAKVERFSTEHPFEGPQPVSVDDKRLIQLLLEVLSAEGVVVDDELSLKTGQGF